MQRAGKSSVPDRLRARHRTRGASSVEWLVVLGLVALVAIGAFRIVGDRTHASADRLSAKVAKLEGAKGGDVGAPGEKIDVKQQAMTATSTAPEPGAFEAVQSALDVGAELAELCFV